MECAPRREAGWSLDETGAAMPKVAVGTVYLIPVLHFLSYHWHVDSCICPSRTNVYCLDEYLDQVACPMLSCIESSVMAGGRDRVQGQ